MQTLLAFLIAILLLVSLHELGHLIVARLCGIKVLRFSVGFGKPFFTKKWRNIEWCLAPIPLGGYVKMVDTREGKVEPADLPFAFDKQHPLKRIAVVVAGPLTNLVLAVLLYCLSFSIGGVTELRPLVGTVYSPSIAARSGFVAGDRIISVNGKSVDNFADAQTEMILNLEAGKVLVDVETADGQHQTRVIDAAGSADATTVAKRQTGIGLSPFKISDNIGMVQPNSPAQKAGLQKGDKIISINQTQTATWEDWSQIVRQNAGRSLNLVYLRNGKEHTTQITPTPVQEANQTIGRVGLAAAMDEEWAKQVRYHYTPSFSQSLQLGWQKTVHYSTLTLSFFGKLVTGNASLAHVSGPITIAEVAGQTAKIGWQPYIEFLALVSISLGVMNLLPVPVLDGGHLVYYTAELLRGKPLNQRVQDWGLRFGLAMMLAMMFLAFFNDITRLLG
ncbi:MAG: RIP metalloprotease RseP [Kingella sp. (in: b-proteobacteria)]